MVSFARYAVLDVLNHNSNKRNIIIALKNIVSINIVKVLSYCDKERDFAHNIYDEIATSPRLVSYMSTKTHIVLHKVIANAIHRYNNEGHNFFTTRLNTRSSP